MIATQPPSENRRPLALGNGSRREVRIDGAESSLTWHDVHLVITVISKCLARVGLGRMQMIGSPSRARNWRPSGFTAICRFDGAVEGTMVIDIDRAMANAVARRLVPQSRGFSDADRVQALDILADMATTDLSGRTFRRRRPLRPAAIEIREPGDWNQEIIGTVEVTVVTVKTVCGECRLAFTPLSPPDRSPPRSASGSHPADGVVLQDLDDAHVGPG